MEVHFLQTYSYVEGDNCHWNHKTFVSGSSIIFECLLSLHSGSQSVNHKFAKYTSGRLSKMIFLSFAIENLVNSDFCRTSSQIFNLVILEIYWVARLWYGIFSPCKRFLIRIFSFLFQRNTAHLRFSIDPTSRPHPSLKRRIFSDHLFIFCFYPLYYSVEEC